MALIQSLTPEEAAALQYEWRFWARPNQLPPPGDWRFWLTLAGRGFGKTRLAAEWIIEQVRLRGRCRVALVGETAADARDVMVEGESGILSCSPPWFAPNYEPSKRRVTWPNGAIGTTFSADEPRQMRGPQYHIGWGDEPAKWRYSDAFDQLNFGVRLPGQLPPQVVLTTTPRPTPLIKNLLSDPDCVTTRGTTYDNASNLHPSYLRSIRRRYEGSRLGRQELFAEVLDDAPGALWKREQIDSTRVARIPALVRVVIAIDPSVSQGDAEDGDDEFAPATGIVAVGICENGHGYVLEDGSLKRPTPEEWGTQAVVMFHRHSADLVIGEVNNGGDLVESNVRAVDKNIPFKQVRASRGKHARAEPISTIAEQGRIHHVGAFPLLEDELCQWEPGVSAWSPNRLDAYVWGFHELMLSEGNPLLEALLSRVHQDQ